MSFIVGILTFFLVINCLALVLLVLVQLPKKDAGAGLAFGGGAADALFGAGSGNALTKITKWAAILFFVLALLLGHLQNKLQHADAAGFLQKIQQQQSQMATPPPAQFAATTNSLLTMPLTAGTNAPVTPTQSK